MTVTAQASALHTLIRDRWPGGTEDRLCGSLVDVMPRVIRQMWTVTPDGYPSASSLSGQQVGGRSASPPGILGVVHGREHGQGAYDEMSRLVRLAALCTADMDRHGCHQALRDATRLADDWSAPLPPPMLEQARNNARCAPEPKEAMQPWTKPECDNLADKAGLCHACYMRRRRWMQSREEGAA